MKALRDLWTGANLDAVETSQIAVQRTFADFDDFWTTSLLGASIGPTVAAMASGDVELLKTRLRRACRRMPRVASPTVRAPTRSRVACQGDCES